MLSGSFLAALVLAIISLGYGYLKKDRRFINFGYVMTGYTTVSLLIILIDAIAGMN